MVTALDDLRQRLRGAPDPEVAASAAVAPAIADSIRYLGSDAAQRSIEADVYWPKWSAPWWHMVLLFELGEAPRIPEPAVTGMLEGLRAFPVKIFPIQPGELPAGADPYRDVMCHCALGSMVQVLAACGRDVDRELPWIKPWFVRYQMADGGLSCDEIAYRQSHECPSSMVGTVAPFEAMLLGAPRDWTRDQASFVERAAGFLIARRLMLGSQTVHNAEERRREGAWLEPCFPRFYFYDVIRGLSALVHWAELTDRPLPLPAISGVVDHVLAASPDGIIRRRRRAHDGVGTWAQDPSGAWARRPDAFRSPLLDATGELGQACPYVTRQWSATRQAIVRLIDRERIVAET
jgi:hypothetical protein